MFKRSIYTIITPLPSTITRETALQGIHDHSGMIELSPVVQHHEKTKPPNNAPPDEFHCIWYSITDRISYFPGIKGQVTYKVCFHDLPNGMQSHCYAPTGLDIKGKWTVGGNAQGEPREVRELGLVGVPREGLYLREDVDMRCSVFFTKFVKGTLQKSHETLVQRLVVKADLEDDRKVRESYRTSVMSPIGSGRTLSDEGSNYSGRSRDSGSGGHAYELGSGPPYPDASRKQYAPRVQPIHEAPGDSRPVDMPRSPEPTATPAQAYLAELSADDRSPKPDQPEWPLKSKTGGYGEVVPDCMPQQA